MYSSGDNEIVLHVADAVLFCFLGGRTGYVCQALQSRSVSHRIEAL